MILTVLADDRTQDAGYEVEHGLSVHLDTGKFKVLLDTGASDVFLRNANVMGIDLADVDYVFISHGHRDHAGGLGHFLQKNEKAEVIVASKALRGAFHSSRRGMHDISPEWPNELFQGRVITVDGNMEVAGMKIISDIGHEHPLPKADNCLYMADAGGAYVHDDFRHELALQVGGLLFTGCAHNGLMNILDAASAPVHTVLGGFHLLDEEMGECFETDNEVQEIASQIQLKYPDAVLYTGHCTGDKIYSSMKQVLGQNLQQFYCGLSVEIKQ